ncbi:MAG: response regulator [Planctomycetaceae bacterium]|nr:response regulator [Planctomycetaceae bacterium]
MNDSMSVLFVDDDRWWLNALRRVVRKSRPHWEAHFVDDGFEALNLSSTTTFDVVVSDLNMPGMRGDRLLDHVARTSPETLRFVLSAGTAEQYDAGNDVAPAEFIPKESAPGDLLSRIDRGIMLRRFMRGRIVRQIADSIRQLGALPNMTMQIINSQEADNQSVSCIEIRCPDLGLEFRTPLNQSSAQTR